ncbi:MAG: methyltransferase domain-containing protein [Planctomycetota bacterium]
MTTATARQLPLPPTAAKRRLEPEVMDDPAIDPALHEAALRGLGRINRFSKSPQMLWPTIERAYRCWQEQANAGDKFRVLDIACGGGDNLVGLARQAERHRLDMEFIGVDMSDTALGFARRAAADAKVQIDFQQRNVFDQPLPDDIDLVTNSLFMHHLTEEQAVAVFRKMADAAHTVLVNDLRRSPLAYAFTVLGTRIITRSPVVHVDGPLSVRAAWTPEELRILAERAGLSNPSIENKFPWRMLLTWSRPDADVTQREAV